MFISSTLHAYFKGDKEISMSQKVTGVLELSGIVGVTVLALLIIANNSATFAVPGLNSMSNLSSAIMLGSAVPLLVLNLVALIIYQKLTEKKKAAVETPQPLPLPAPNTSNLEQQLRTKQAELLILQQDKGRLEAEKSALALKVKELEAEQAQLLKMKPKSDPEATKTLESQKAAIDGLQKDKKALEENLNQLNSQLATQTHTAQNDREKLLEQNQKVQQLLIEQKLKIEQFSQKEKELDTLKSQLQQAQLAGNANAGDKVNFEAEKKRLEEEFTQRVGQLQDQLKDLGKKNRELQKQIGANTVSNDQSIQKKLQQKSEHLREYELKTSKLEAEIATLKKQLQQAGEAHAENQAQLTKEQEEARTQSRLKIQELQKQLNESTPKRRNVVELKMEKEEKDKIREQLLAPTNVRKTKDELTAEIATIEASTSTFREASQKAQQEEAAGANQRTTTTTTTTSTSPAPQPTGGPPPPPNGLRPPPPGGAPKLPTSGGTRKVAQASNGQNGKEKEKTTPTLGFSPEELILQRRRNTENNSTPKMPDEAKEALDKMLNSKVPEAALQLKRFEEVLEDIKGYLRDKELTANFSLDGMSMNKRLGTFSLLPESIREYFISLITFMYEGSEKADKKARAKACMRIISEEIVLTNTNSSQTQAPESLAGIMNRALSNLRVDINGNDEDSDEDSWSD